MFSDDILDSCTVFDDPGDVDAFSNGDTETVEASLRLPTDMIDGLGFLDHSPSLSSSLDFHSMPQVISTNQGLSSYSRAAMEARAYSRSDMGPKSSVQGVPASFSSKHHGYRVEHTPPSPHSTFSARQPLFHQYPYNSTPPTGNIQGYSGHEPYRFDMDAPGREYPGHSFSASFQESHSQLHLASSSLPHSFVMPTAYPPSPSFSSVPSSPSIIPQLSSYPVSPSLSPTISPQNISTVNYSKREKNRQAAERCRKKKQDLIARLSIENQLLHQENAQLLKTNMLLEQKVEYMASVLSSSDSTRLPSLYPSTSKRNP